MRFGEKGASLKYSSGSINFEEGNGWAVVRAHLRFVVINLKGDSLRDHVCSSSTGRARS